MARANLIVVGKLWHLDKLLKNGPLLLVNVPTKEKQELRLRKCGAKKLPTNAMFYNYDVRK